MGTCEERGCGRLRRYGAKADLSDHVNEKTKGDVHPLSNQLSLLMNKIPSVTSPCSVALCRRLADWIYSVYILSGRHTAAPCLN